MAANGRFISPVDRTFERTQGCYNCTHFENGELARQHWKTCKERDLTAYTAEGKMPLTRLGDMETDVFSGTIYDRMEQAIKSGQYGMCLAGKAAGDFTHFKFLCPSGWNGKQGYSVATGGITRAPDKEIGELIEIADSRAKKPLGQ